LCCVQEGRFVLSPLRVQTLIASHVFYKSTQPCGDVYLSPGGLMKSRFAWCDSHM
jgi:hypothetical protein